MCLQLQNQAKVLDKTACFSSGQQELTVLINYKTKDAVSVRDYSQNVKHNEFIFELKSHFDTVEIEISNRWSAAKSLNFVSVID